MTVFGIPMTSMKRIPPLLLLIGASPILAQTAEVNETDDNTATVEVTESGLSEPTAVGTGPEDPDDESQTMYIGAVHGDWDVRCVRMDENPDPCQLYQLLVDNSGNPVAEFSVFPVTDDVELIAGATVVTPLETLLTVPVEISVDGGEPKSYPFLWCSSLGCVSRVGLVEADVNAFKGGLRANLSIVPARAADRKVNLTVSLMGFSAGFSDLQVRSER